jgi:GNAT superfamily N-acetyltransferase
MTGLPTMAAPPGLHITHATLDQVRANRLGGRLYRFNTAAVGAYEVEAVAFDARGPAGELLGGVRGVLALGWLIVKLLWVQPEARRHGLGAALLQAAESMAHARGVHKAWGAACTWQDLEFLRLRGYAEFAGIPDYVGAHGLKLLARTWDAPPPPPAPTAREWRIAVPGAEDGRRSLYAGLCAFNASVIGRSRTEALRLAATRSDGRVVGGLNGDLMRGWLKINVLVLDEDARRGGLGSSLLAAAERFAGDAGARGIWLETFDWQAPAFYAARGYRRFGRIDGYVAGHGLTFMRRDLQRA